MPQVWQAVKKLAHFIPEVSIRDQQFFEEVQKRLQPEENREFLDVLKTYCYKLNSIEQLITRL
jgi:hypothetical protein